MHYTLVSKGFWLLISSIILFGILHTRGRACTIFLIQSNGQVVYGQNLDWLEPTPGYAIVNQPGITKRILPWEGDWPSNKRYKDQTWISKYGSVTFTCWGIDFIEGGMNEVGLAIDEASLYAIYPPEDNRPGVSCSQWMQYMLDNFATVQEVLAHLDTVRIDGEGWHFLVADRTGDWAIIEYLDGTPTIYSPENAKWPVATNTTYSHALTHIPMDVRYGGDINIGAGDDSYGRFIQAASLLDANAANPRENIEDYAFSILQAVGNKTTRRSVIYDLTNMKVAWTTELFGERRWLDLKQLSFIGGTPPLGVDTEIADYGDVKQFLEPYTLATNKTLAETRRDLYSTSEGTSALLQNRGLTRSQAYEIIARHPDYLSP